MLHLVNIKGVTSGRCSAIATGAQEAAAAPIVFVHGILDSVYRWVTPADLAAAGLALRDDRIPAPVYDVALSQAGRLGTMCGLMAGQGLLTEADARGLPAVAYSYQDVDVPVQTMASAVERLHRAADWAMQYWGATRVSVVGHSRGGLVARHALVTDSPVMTAREFQHRVGRLVTIATPHLGSKLAHVMGPLIGAFGHFERANRRIARLLESFHAPALDPLLGLRQMVANVAQLTPDADEIVAVATASLPKLSEGYFAIAGSDPTCFWCELPVVGRLEWPPLLPVPELTPGQGDCAVAVPSALDIPGGESSTTACHRLNHLSIALGSGVQRDVFRWLQG